MDTKTCAKCGRTFPATTEFFYLTNRGGLKTQCKACVAAHARAYYETHKEEAVAKSRAYYEAHKDKRIAAVRAYNEAHREQVGTYREVYKERAAILWRTYYETHRERLLAASRAWQKRNSDRLNDYRRRRHWADSKLRLNHSLAGAIRKSLHACKAGRHWESLVGYTLEDLVHHLESLFQPGMTWQNYGYRGWTVDHVKPQSAFDFSSPDDPEFNECWALSNLQPLWAKDNLRKGAKYEQ